MEPGGFKQVFESAVEEALTEVAGNYSNANDRRKLPAGVKAFADSLLEPWQGAAFASEGGLLGNAYYATHAKN